MGRQAAGAPWVQHTSPPCICDSSAAAIAPVDTSCPPPPLPLPPLQTVDVQAKFVNGKPSSIEVKYVMRSTFEWDRFMRFMERYAEDQGLGFQKS